ncbi:MAG: hypothetical protein ACOYKQ_01265, partial [Polymorphobacter sp.]
MTISALIRSNIGLYSAIFFFTLLAIEIIAIKRFHARGRIPAKDATLGVLTGVLSDPVNGLSAFITLGI